MSKRGIILFAHGARDPRWARPFEAVHDQLKSLLPDTLIRLAFLEFMTPDLPSAGADLAQQGCQQVMVIPLFLGAGGHVRKDLPELVRQLQEEFAQTQWILQPAIGESALFINALTQCIAASVNDSV